MSEMLNKSSHDSISIWLFDQMIFCSIYVLYYGCISPLRFSEIRHKITSNQLLQLKIGKNCSTLPFYHVGVTSACYIYNKISYLDDSSHKLLMILHTNLEIVDDSAQRMITQVQHTIHLRFYQSEANDIDMSLLETMTPLGHITKIQMLKCPTFKQAVKTYSAISLDYYLLTKSSQSPSLKVNPIQYSISYLVWVPVWGLWSKKNILPWYDCHTNTPQQLQCHRCLK